MQPLSGNQRRDLRTCLTEVPLVYCACQAKCIFADPLGTSHTRNPFCKCYKTHTCSVAGVALGDIYRRFSMASVALGDIDLHFAGGVALGDMDFPFAWQVWQLCHIPYFTHNFVTHYLSHTTWSHTIFHILSHITLSHTIFPTLSRTTLSHTIFHTQLCHTPSFTHNLVTHHLSHTQKTCHTPSFTHNLSHTIFHTQLCHTPSFTHNFVTHHLSHTTLSHTIFHTQLCHTPSFTPCVCVLLGLCRATYGHLSTR